MASQPPPTLAAKETAYRETLLTAGTVETSTHADDAAITLLFADAMTSLRRVSCRGPH